MMRMSGAAVIAALAMSVTSYASQAQTATAPRGTNGAGTAQSSGGPALHSQPGVTTGSARLGSGNAKPPPTESADSTIKQENRTIDGKLKGICRGC